MAKANKELIHFFKVSCSSFHFVRLVEVKTQNLQADFFLQILGQVSEWIERPLLMCVVRTQLMAISINQGNIALFPRSLKASHEPSAPLTS